MDPQACLDRIVKAVRTVVENPDDRKQIDYLWDNEVAPAFEDLAGWLRKGGFPPEATGPIFGSHSTPLPPGIVCGALPNDEIVKIRHVRSGLGAIWKYVIQPYDPERRDLTRWVLCEYNALGEEIANWPLAASYKCSRCGNARYRSTNGGQYDRADKSVGRINDGGDKCTDCKISDPPYPVGTEIWVKAWWNSKQPVKCRVDCSGRPAFKHLDVQPLSGNPHKRYIDVKDIIPEKSDYRAELDALHGQ